MLLHPLRKRSGAHTPFGVGIAPPRADPGTRRVNEHQVRAFLARQSDFTLLPPVELTGVLEERAPLFREAALISEQGLLMTPRSTDTDGFYVAVLVRRR